jgi:hypothetical protein
LSAPNTRGVLYSGNAPGAATTTDPYEVGGGISSAGNGCVSDTGVS